MHSSMVSDVQELKALMADELVTRVEAQGLAQVAIQSAVQNI